MSNSPHAFGGLDPALGHAHDRRLLEIDERDVRVVVRLVVAGHERRPLLGEAVILRDQLLRGLGILDDAADLLGDELAPLGVRGCDRTAGRCSGCVSFEKPGLLHIFSKNARRSLVRVVEGGAIVRGVEEPAHRRVQRLAHRLEVGPELRLLLGRDRRVVERRAPVGGALVHGQRGNLVGDRRDQLDAARSGADDGDALAREVDGRRRPQSRVVLTHRGSRRARHVGEVRHREHAGRGDEEPRAELGAVAERDGPRARRLVVLRRRDRRVEADVAAEVEPVDHVVEVALDLRLLARSAPATPIRRTALSRTGTRRCSSPSRSGRRGSGSSTTCRRRRRRPRAASRRSRLRARGTAGRCR